MSTTRPVTIVIGYDSERVRRFLHDVREAGLTDTVATVLPTYREGNPEPFLDHPLWVACARAVSALVHADASEVLVDAAPTILDKLLHRVRSDIFGSFEAYAELVSQSPDAPLWQQVRWRQMGRLVAAATHEAWWRVGGPEPYHDFYTSCFLICGAAVTDAVAAIRSAVKAEGASVDQVVNM